MKNVFLLALLCVFCAPLFGQIQVGLVREQNSGNRPIGGVQINFEHAVPTTSADEDGTFRLAFKGLKPGYPIFKQDIFKHGFELVNEREIESLKISNDNKLGVDIIMAPKDSISAAKARYHNIAVRELTAGLERERKALKVKLEREEMKSEAYFAQLEKLQKDFDRQQKELDPLANQFARVNFDDVDSVYQQALQLFKSGKVDEAIATLENADPVSQIGKVIAQQQKNIEDEQELEIRKKQTQKIKQEVIAKAKLLSDMYSMQFNPKKAEILYDTLLRLDSTDLEILTNASKFYRENHRYEKVKRVLSLIISHPNAERWEVADALRFLGVMHKATGNLPDGLAAFEESKKIYIELCQGDLASSSFKHGLAIAYERLGSTYLAVGDLPKALTFFEKDIELSKELHETYPKNVNFERALAISYQYLGITHTALGDLSMALTLFEQFNQLMKELHDNYPQNVDFKNGLAISYSKLGNTYTDLGNLHLALTFFGAYSNLEKELYETYPQNADFKDGLAISYARLGNTYTALGNLPKALTFFEEYNKLEKELYAVYPQNVHLKFGLALSCQYLGSTHAALGNLPKALTCFEDGNKLLEKLHAAHPNSVDFTSGLANLYQTLGDFYSEKQNNIQLALLHYQKADTLWTELVRDAPENSEYQKQLAEVRGKLAELGQNMPETTPQSQQREKTKAAITSFTLTQETSLRAAPASDAKVLRRFKPGDQVRPLEKTDEWWWKVAFGGIKGYVKAALLKELENR
jgi:tetratricopeptide (TPR) repeat protein